jgi:flagellar hook-associated protein 2
MVNSVNSNNSSNSLSGSNSSSNTTSSNSSNTSNLSNTGTSGSNSINIPGAGLVSFSGLSTGIDTNQIIQEMATIARQPETIYRQDMQQIQARQAAYNALSAQLLTLQTAALNLDTYSTFRAMTVSSSNQNVVTATAQPGAQAGTHTITVNALAQAEMISTAAQTSQTAPLGFSGQLLINGKAINVSAADSLQSLATNINSAQAGVRAAIISPSQGQYYLTIASVNTGLAAQISIADVGNGNLLQQLGIAGTGGRIRHPLSSSGGGAGSDLFTDSVTPIYTLEGLSSAPAGDVQIQLNNGSFQTVHIDLSQSLSQIASAINAALGTNAASVQNVTDPYTGQAKQQLQIAGATGFVDSNNVLADLGIYQVNLAQGRELAQAQDASFTLDGIAATRPTNSFSDAISGVTINLLQASNGSSGPATATITISSDTSTIQKDIQDFVQTFNSTIDMIDQQSQYDPNTGQTGILFGDSTIESLKNTLTAMVTGQVPGLPSSLSLLSQIGITLDQTGHLNVDQNALSQALSTNLQGVAQLFQSSGSATDPNVQFVTSGPNTQPSPPQGYAIVITQPATQAQLTVASPQTQPLATDETLTFGGPLFGTPATTSGTLTGPSITLHAGSTASDVVNQINSDPVISAVVSASLDSQGRLQLTSKQYGSQATFDVVSSAPASASSTGIGTTIQQVSGQDVAGTINGEVATGHGQFLTDTQQGTNGVGQGRAVGLEVRVTATQPGTYGTVSFTSGVADMLKNFLNTQTDPITGALTLAVNQMQTQYQDDQQAINDIEANIALQEQMWLQEFTNMEQVVSNLRASSAGLAMFGASLLPSSSASSSGSSASTGG